MESKSSFPRSFGRLRSFWHFWNVIQRQSLRVCLRLLLMWLPAFGENSLPMLANTLHSCGCHWCLHFWWMQHFFKFSLRSKRSSADDVITSKMFGNRCYKAFVCINLFLVNRLQAKIQAPLSLANKKRNQKSERERENEWKKTTKNRKVAVFVLILCD